MKKSISILLSALSLFSGCTMEESPFQEEQNNKSNGKEITLRATREDDPETRTVLESDGSVWWTPGDAISLFYGSGTDGGSKFTSNSTDTTKVTNFTGVITAITGGGEISVDETFFWGVYPYRDDVSCDGSSVTMTLPSQQTAVPGTFATDLFPSMGRSQGLIMGFYNVCGGWRFSVTKEGVRKVTLKSNNGELITGKVKVGFDDSGIPEVREIIDGSDEVVLECPAGEYFEVGKNYYMILLPTTFSAGFTMTFETYTEEGVYDRTASTTVKRSKFSGITNIDKYLTTPYSQKTGNITIEDANFKAYLVENFDENGDGEISLEEAGNIFYIYVGGLNIQSLQGIEYMPALDYLECYDNRLTSLDLSNNLALTELSCSGNQLTSLNVSNCTALNYLQCTYNRLTSLNVSNCTALDYLECYDNRLTSLDLSNNMALTGLYCYENQLTSLNVSNCTALNSLQCSDNRLTSLNVSDCTALEHLYCPNNQLTNLDVSNCTALESLSCYFNQLNGLDVSNKTALTSLACGNNQLTSLDVSDCTALTDLNCPGNQLTSLNVSDCTALTILNCPGNQLTSLDVSNNTALTSLICFDNPLTGLDVSNNAALTEMDCNNILLTSLDVSNNTALTNLNCSYNQLTCLNISHNTALSSLQCNNNQLTSLDLSNNVVLTELLCGNNQLVNLDVSMNRQLNSLRCSPMSSLSSLIISYGQSIPSVTIDRSNDFIPEGTEIVYGPYIYFSSTHGSTVGYHPPYWWDDFEATFFNVRVPGSNNNPDDCQFHVDINSPFIQYTRDDPTNCGKLFIDKIETAIYSFNKPRMESITKIGDVNVSFRVSDDCCYLYASILNEQGVQVGQEELVATIINEPEQINGYTIWNSFKYIKGGEVSGELLNTGEMYVLISCSVTVTTGYVFQIYYNNEDCFKADILRPISVACSTNDCFIDNVDLGIQSINIDYSITNWRGFWASESYYGPYEISYDIDNAQCDIDGIRQALPSSIVLSQTDSGNLTYQNTGINVAADYNIYIKVNVSYGFGTVHSDWIKIPVLKMQESD